MPAARIISLLPAATEAVCRFGAAGRLVGRSHACDHPPEVAGVPVCTAPRFDSSAPGGVIDRRVRELAATGGGCYQLDEPLIRSLQPDLILTQAQCPVCAVSQAEVEALVARLPGPPPKVLALAPARMANIWEELLRIAEALDFLPGGRELLRPLKERVVAIIEKTCVVSDRPGVVCLEWLDPLMAAGHWLPELVELAGGRNLLGTAGRPSAPVNWEAVRAADPQVLILLPCGFDLARTRREVGALTRLPGWDRLRAVRKGRVFLADGDHYFNRPGPRIVESLEALAEICHPRRFAFGHAGRVWQPL